MRKNTCILIGFNAYKMRKNTQEFPNFHFYNLFKTSKIQNIRKADMNANRRRLGNARSIR